MFYNQSIFHIIISVNGSEPEATEEELIRIQMNGHSDSNSINSRASSSRISSSRVSSHSRAADVEDEGQASPTKKRPMSAKKRSVRIVDGHTSMEESSTNQNGDTNDGLTNQNGDIQGTMQSLFSIYKILIKKKVCKKMYFEDTSNIDYHSIIHECFT